ncbi:GNAT family N-acetyltransferase [Nakamurella endophytica]|uniref:GNAT family N-acetyltransferase n=1 Tax=Nakamurella endophytica TaxID=1748367 RepID=A0A917WHL8_9ACTN|nr:GNAT family N-acetyltransferase [Nakamurella endophytica]GGM03992.1 hypothetical protein GCM10011594_25200 [Nakamurella endophytica]
MADRPTVLQHAAPSDAVSADAMLADAVLADARQVAARRAERAGIRIAALDDLADLERACRLLDEVWQTRPGDPSEMQPPLLRALRHSGSYVVGAWSGPDLVAASVGFFGAPSTSSLHSHITGVLTDRSGRGVGAAVKWHQRAWTLAAGARWVTWTFDPLIARNAHFNLHRLRATAVEYLTDFYGTMTDGRNAGQPSDRLLAHWDLRSPAVASAGRGTDPVHPGDPDPGSGTAPPRAVPVLVDEGGRPVARPATDAEVVSVAVPDDVEALRGADPATALRWRLAVRETVAPLLAAGWSVVGFRRPEGYLVARPPGGTRGRDR